MNNIEGKKIVLGCLESELESLKTLRELIREAYDAVQTFDNPTIGDFDRAVDVIFRGFIDGKNRVIKIQRKDIEQAKIYEREEVNHRLIEFSG